MTDLMDMYRDAAAKKQTPTRILAIDPGNQHSAYVLLDADTRRPIEFDKCDNDELRARLHAYWDTWNPEHVAIEMVASYGMAVGREVFETCVWIGRFYEQITRQARQEPRLQYRLPVKVHHCHSAKAKDSNVRQALVDRFAPGQPNYGKGTKANPGWFHGFSADVWAAYAVGVYVADLQAGAPF